MGKYQGLITKEAGAYITTQEQAAADFLAQLGYDVVFIAVARTKHQRTADILMNGLIWEIKTPTGNGSRTIENILRSGKHQSENIILDLRFTKRSDTQCIVEARGRFNLSKGIQRLMIIRKPRGFLELTR